MEPDKCSPADEKPISALEQKRRISTHEQKNNEADK
jgi:hypothetical protein